MKQKMLWDVKVKHKKPNHSKPKRPTAHYCNICGKPLYDPISISRGIGEECWKLEEKRRAKCKNLFKTDK